MKGNMAEKRIAIVTGASGGLGREFVRIFAKDKAINEIWAVARGRAELERLSEEFGRKVRIMPRDLSKFVQVQSLAKTLAEEETVVRYVVNCAGYAKFGAYCDVDVEESLNND